MKNKLLMSGKRHNIDHDVVPLTGIGFSGAMLQQSRSKSVATEIADTESAGGEMQTLDFPENYVSMLSLK